VHAIRARRRTSIFKADGGLKDANVEGAVRGVAAIPTDMIAAIAIFVGGQIETGNAELPIWRPERRFVQRWKTGNLRRARLTARIPELFFASDLYSQGEFPVAPWRASAEPGRASGLGF
jgi:hypothetical protein